MAVLRDNDFNFIFINFISWNNYIIFLNEIIDEDPSASNPYTNGQYVDPNITVSGIGRGSNIGPDASAAPLFRLDTYIAKNWDVIFHPDDYLPICMHVEYK